jgi:hypothetical protein
MSQKLILKCNIKIRAGIDVAFVPDTLRAHIIWLYIHVRVYHIQLYVPQSLIYIHKNKHIHIYIYIHINIYIHIYIHTNTHTQTVLLFLSLPCGILLCLNARELASCRKHPGAGRHTVGAVCLSQLEERCQLSVFL